MPEAPILKTDALCSGYGRSQVLFGVSIDVPAQGAICVLGRNGAGKTTLLKTLAGDLPTMSGSIEFDGRRIDGTAMESRARAGVGYVPQENAAFSGLTVKENLQLGAIRQKDKSGIDEVLAVFPKLGKRLHQPAGTLSGGERKMLAIGRAMLGRPRLLMLDEPTEGVWIGVIEEIAEQLERLAKTMSVILVEQHVELALRVARTAYVMDRGRIALQGPVAQVRDDPELIRYLSP
ncbi:ABC transporter ATP-binding protein [Burkholderiaceae bacterium FT117]|uniref:ABC transporter ATP-binding protein n=1 Tax=Zeimonas sediminis TaxID=2944268 RepID=UPI00234306E5|nr:ABC transporter ATP-binding protein [Zeimonas sediminis]MCM5571263.1 ABC transporter ATP-binding protein [Zeimonas sediminis]